MSPRSSTYNLAPKDFLPDRLYTCYIASQRQACRRSFMVSPVFFKSVVSLLVAGAALVAALPAEHEDHLLIKRVDGSIRVKEPMYLTKREYSPAWSWTLGKKPAKEPCAPSKLSVDIQAAECYKNTRQVNSWTVSFRTNLPIECTGPAMMRISSRLSQCSTSITPKSRNL